MHSGKAEKKRLQLKISGLVQGVFYRVHARDEAQRLGLKGWVRNCTDGSVEALAEGTEDLLKEFASWCEQGSPSARVDQVERSWSVAKEKFDDFSVRY